MLSLRLSVGLHGWCQGCIRRSKFPGNNLFFALLQTYCVASSDMIAFVWADNYGAEPVMELCAAPASGIYVLKLSVGGEGGQKYTLTYMFVMLDDCLRDVCGRGTEPTSARSERLLDPGVRERMNRHADIKIPSTNAVLSLPKQRRFVLRAASPAPPLLFPLAGLIL